MVYFVYLNIYSLIGDMDKWVNKWVSEQRRKGKKRIEVKQNGNRYYVYDSTTVWDKKKKKAKKISKYRGRLTREGFIKGEKRIAVRNIFEYGNSLLVHNAIQPLLKPLKKAFPNHYQEITAMAVVKTIDPQPIKLISSRWSKLHISTLMNPFLSPNKLSEILREVGSDIVNQKMFFEEIASEGDFLLFDLSYVFSQSENLLLAEKGYNKDHLHLPQVNIALLYSVNKQLPAMIKVLPGSVRDIKSFKKTLEEVSLDGVTVVVDRGMASYNLIPVFKEKHMSFVLPLKRNFKVIDYSMELNEFFVYRKRSVKWGKKKLDDVFLYLFEDVKLRSEEENTFISQIVAGSKKREDLRQQEMKFGKITMLSDLDINGESIYNMYKQREHVECAFDVLKNPLESDKTYLGDDDAVRGYFFVSFVALYNYYALMNRLREKELLKKVSVRELLLQFSKVYVVTDGRREIISEVPKKVEDLAEKIGVDISTTDQRAVK